MANALARALGHLAALQEQFEIGRERARLLEEELRALNGERGDRGRRERRSRYPGDLALIERGVNMVLDGDAGSANQAAQTLAALEPGFSVEATRDRLGRAIRCDG